MKDGQDGQDGKDGKDGEGYVIVIPNVVRDLKFFGSEILRFAQDDSVAKFFFALFPVLPAFPVLPT